MILVVDLFDHRRLAKEIGSRMIFLALVIEESGR
jgi:hypothetical protein